MWLDEILSREGLDATTALFSESSARAIVAVPREEDVKFMRLCEGRGVPVMRIGVTDTVASLELQDYFTLELDELRSGWSQALSAL